MKIDWKRKLTSRKFWAAVCGFVSMVVMATGKDAGVAQTVTGMIMAGASLIAYMIGEGLSDSKPSENGTHHNYTVIKDDDREPVADIADANAICKHGYTVLVDGKAPVSTDADTDILYPDDCKACKISFGKDD